MAMVAKDKDGDRLTAPITPRDTKYRRKRGKGKPKQLDEMAARVGYTNSEFCLARLADDIVMAEEWIGYLNVGMIPPELFSRGGGRSSLRTAEIACRTLLKEIEERDKGWREYFHAKLKPVDSDGNSDEKPIELRVKFGRDE